MAEALAWNYSDWVTKDVGDPLRLSRLRLHIQEVSNFLSSGNYQFFQGSRVFDKAYLVTYLKDLRATEEKLANAATAANSATQRATFLRGRAIPE